MKAFQMKIVIKNSHPPIWRRFIVPSGLSFSQFSIVLNEVMGWCGYHLSEFEFYHRGISFLEDSREDMFYESQGFDSAEYIIDEFMEKEEWFTYYYDFGDDWAHRVTIEKVLRGYEYNYPMVLKFKGDTPYEDCGGIEGYYHLLNILENPFHPEHKQMKEWTEQHFTKQYDMDYVNKKLSNYKLTDERSAPMTQNEIYQEILEKGLPFKRIQGKREVHLYDEEDILGFWENMDGELEMPEEIDWEEAFNEIQQQWRDNNLFQYPEDLEEVTLKMYYQKLNKNGLIDISRKHGLKGYTKYNKAQLAAFVSEQIVCREEIRKYFLFLTEEEIQLLNQGAVKSGGYVHEWQCDPGYIVAGGYAVALSLKHVLIPKEVWLAYAQHCDSQWRKQWKETQELLTALNGAAALYGICPLGQFQMLYERQIGKTIEKAELKKFLESIPRKKAWFQFEGREIIWNEINEEEVVRELKRLHHGNEYYLPKRAELLQLGSKGYLPFDKSMIKLRSYIENSLEESRADAEIYCREIQEIFRTGGTFQDVMVYLADAYVLLEEELLDGLFKLLSEVSRHTRMISMQGFTPEEITRREHSIIIDFEERKSRKLYPNDKCPCGSGKKYKHCCGKKTGR